MFTEGFHNTYRTPTESHKQLIHEIHVLASILAVMHVQEGAHLTRLSHSVGSSFLMACWVNRLLNTILGKLLKYNSVCFLCQGIHQFLWGLCFSHCASFPGSHSRLSIFGLYVVN